MSVSSVLEKEVYPEDMPPLGPLDFDGWNAQSSFYTARGIRDPMPLRYYYTYMSDLNRRKLDAYMLEEPTERVEQLRPLVEEALAQPVWLPAAGEWQLPASIDRLTGAMTRLRDYAAALALLDSYFALPAEYKTRSTPSYEASLAKRTESCRKKLGL